MRLDRRPLLDTTVDADLFVGREAEIARLLRAVELSLNTVVTGCRGIGRSSLLRRLALCLRQRQVETVQLSASGVEDAADLLLRLLRRLAGDEAVAVVTLAGLDADGLVEHLGRTLADRSRRTVVLADDLSVPAGRSLFGALRDELWRLELTWVVSSDDESADALLQPPVDAFFELVVPVGPLTEGEAVEMARRRLGTSLPGAAPSSGAASAGAASAGAVSAGAGPSTNGAHPSPPPPDEAELARLAGLAGGHPRRLVDLLRAVLVDGATPEALAAQAESRQARLSTVSASAAALAAELEALGPAGPSDASLQRRMKVSRPRLISLFAELRDAGLVRELGPDRDHHGPGRPRIRYVLTDPG
jgi:hypothetical protein